MVEKAKAQTKKAANDTWRAIQVLASLLVSVALIRASVVTWQNNEIINGLPVDRIVAGIGLALVLSYVTYLHYKKD